MRFTGPRSAAPTLAVAPHGRTVPHAMSMDRLSLGLGFYMDVWWGWGYVPTWAISETQRSQGSVIVQVSHLKDIGVASKVYLEFG